MKIVAISDTHGHAFSHLIPECDVLIHAGDISPMHDHSFWHQRQWFLDNFIPELRNCKANQIIFIAGNHDFFLHDTFKSKNEEWLIKQLPDNVKYLRDSGFEIDGVSFWGTPWVVNLDRWAFSLNERPTRRYPIDQIAELESHFNMIPDKTDFLISHGPAFGYSDTIMQYNRTDNIGSLTLRDTLLKKNIKYCLTGHIHSANHEEQRMLLSPDNLDIHTKCFCVSLLDENYELTYKPKLIII